MRPYVEIEPLQLVNQINQILMNIQPLWNEKRFHEAENLYRDYYGLMRYYEDELPEGKRFHKGTPLHNWGVSMLLQEDAARKREGLSKIFLAYIEDLIDFDSIEQVHSAPAYRTLVTFPFYQEALASAQSRVEELREARRIPKNPEDVLTERLSEEAEDATEETDENKSKTVFVVHGRNIEARDSMYAFLRSIGLIPINLPEAIGLTNSVTPYVGEILDKAFSLAQAVVVLMTPDDIGCLRKPFRKRNDARYETEFTPQARLNVIFEAGMAMGGEFRNRTIIVELGKLRQLSDLHGRFVVRLNNSPDRREDLITRLENADCDIDRSNDDWQTAGDFESVLEKQDGFLFGIGCLFSK